MQGVSHQSLTQRVALVDQNFDTIRRRAFNVLVAKSPDCTDEFTLSTSTPFKIYFRVHLHRCDVQVLAVLNQSFLPEPKHGVEPVIECDEVESGLELANEVENESSFSSGYVSQTAVDHHLLQVVLREQVITVRVILDEQLLAVN